MKQSNSKFSKSTTGSRRVTDLDPLVNYLEPRFGKRHYFETDGWAAELQEAVRHYLAFEVDGDLYAAMLGYLTHLPDDIASAPREVQADFIVANNTPCEVTAAAHWAAVKSCGMNFGLYVRSLLTRPGPFDYEDVALWLEHQTTYDERVALVHELDPKPRPGAPKDANTELDIETWLYNHRPEPEALVAAWEAMADLSRGRE